MNQPLDFAETLSELIQERSRLWDQRITLETELSEVTNRLGHVNGAIQHISPLAGTTDDDPFVDDLSVLGITDAIRHVLRESKSPLSAAEIFKILGEKKFDMSKYSSPMSSVYKILSRLIDDSKEVERVKSDEGSKSAFKFQWVRPSAEIDDDDIPF